jgi:hypothetical protein
MVLAVYFIVGIFAAILDCNTVENNLVQALGRGLGAIAFANALIQIADEAVKDPELLHNAPHTTPVGRLDEVRAAREPILRYVPE